MQKLNTLIKIPATLQRQLYRKYSRLALDKLRLMNVNRCFPNSHFIFVLSPMRSGSTLLQHILESGSSSLSSGESHLIYRSPDDLKRLILKIYAYNGYLGFRPKTVIEKCCHDELVETPDIFNRPNIKVIFLLRDPASTISSLLRAKGFAYSETVESASSYYLKRIENLKFVSSKLRHPDQAFFLTYKQLVTDAKNTLNALSKFLELATPLNPTYETRKWTGVLGIGDFSRNIKHGRIVKDTGSEKIDLPSTTEKTLDRAYGDAVKYFEERVITACVNKSTYGQQA